MTITRRTALAGGAAMSLVAHAAHARGLSIQSGRAPVPGGSIRWWKVGGGPKTPLLTLHGGPGAGHNYLKPLEALANERPVIFYDQLGCGEADSPPDPKLYHVPRFAAEVDAVRHALGLERIVLFGHSWGSVLAIEYLCEGRGTGVEKLILGGALASVPQASAGMQRLLARLPNGAGARLQTLASQGKFDDPEYERLAQIFYHRHVCRAEPWPPEVNQSLAIAAKSIAYRLMNGPNEFTIIGTMKNWDRRADLHRIRLPTLITTGEFDEVTMDCHETLHRGIAGSRLQVFPGCSHLTMNEQPAAYVAALRAFMRA